MNNHESLFFAGVDWGRGSHQVCVVDQQGSLIGERNFRHSGGGLFEMAQWIQQISDSEACDIAVAIEVNHGPVVESLLEQGFRIYSINPRQLDRFRDRFCVSGAKDDRRDAMVLASALRTDRPRFRCVRPQHCEVVILREFNRTREELTRERNRLVNRFRGLLYRYYPQFGELLGKKVRPWHLELWELAPSPQKAKRKRISTVQNLLRRNRTKRFNAKEVLRMLRGEKMSISEATTQSCVWHIGSIIERLRVVDRQLRETEGSISEVIETMNEKLRTEGEGATDIEILRSVPGVGPVVLTTLIAEAWDLIRRRDLKALRCLGGVAPVTKQSGKTKLVIKRRAVCKSLCDAFHVLGGMAVINDPVSRARYEELRKKGHSYCRSVRTVCDRLLSVVCTILKKRELFDKEFKKPMRNAA